MIWLVYLYLVFGKGRGTIFCITWTTTGRSSLRHFTNFKASPAGESFAQSYSLVFRVSLTIPTDSTGKLCATECSSSIANIRKPTINPKFNEVFFVFGPCGHMRSWAGNMPALGVRVFGVCLATAERTIVCWFVAVATCHMPHATVAHFFQMAKA